MLTTPTPVAPRILVDWRPFIPSPSRDLAILNNGQEVSVGLQRKITRRKTTNLLYSTSPNARCLGAGCVAYLYTDATQKAPRIEHEISD